MVCTHSPVYILPFPILTRRAPILHGPSELMHAFSAACRNKTAATEPNAII